MSLVAALTDAILPVLSIAAVGYALGRGRDVDVDGIATVTIYVLTPALVFHSLVTTPIGEATAFVLGAGVVAYTLGMLAIAAGVGSALGESGATYGGLLLSSSFPNAGNYGIPLAAFAFGAVGRSTAVLYIVFQSVLMYTAGVSIASEGASTSVRDAVVEIFRLPLVYAVVAAPLSPPANPPALVIPAWFGAVDLAFVLLGHLVAVWVAHATAYDLFPSRLQAVRSQYGVTAVMVGYTMLSLWIVAEPYVTPPFIAT